MTTSVNEGTHFFIKIYQLHLILERVMFVVCERWVGDRDRLLYWPHNSSDHSSTPFTSWLSCSTVGNWGPQSPQSANWFSRWHPLSNWLEPSGHLVILLSYVHLLPLFFRLFTQVHLLIDGSVKGQYITKMVKQFHLISVIRLFTVKWIYDLWTAWQLFPLDDNQTCHSKDSGSDTSWWKVMGRYWVGDWTII